MNSSHITGSPSRRRNARARARTAGAPRTTERLLMPSEASPKRGFTITGWRALARPGTGTPCFAASRFESALSRARRSPSGPGPV
ncbi:hypothetical protein D3C83_19800 [compost metagenome]